MLTSDQINVLKDKAGQITNRANEYAIEEISRHIAEAGEFTRTAEYKRYRAQALGADYDELLQEVARRLNEDKAIIELLHREAAKAMYETEVPDFRRQTLPFEQNASLQQIIRASVDLADEDFANVTQTMGMVSPAGKNLPLKQFYHKTMDWVFNNVTTGLMDYDTAIRKASAILSDKGLTVIEYESGVTTSLEAAVRRNVMSGLGLMAERVGQYNYDLIEADGWEMSAHPNSAPDHEPYQGRQYPEKEWQELNGTPDKPGKLLRRIGTLNCGHYAMPIIIGVNQPQHTEEQLQKLAEENAKGVTVDGKHYTGYEATQRQRAIESKIKKWKKRAKASLSDEEQALQAKIRLTRAQSEYKRFSEAAGLKTQDERLHASGFDFKVDKRLNEIVKGSRKSDILTESPKKHLGIEPITQKAIDSVAVHKSKLLDEQQTADLLNAEREILLKAKDYPVGTEVGAAYSMDFKQKNVTVGEEGAGGVDIRGLDEDFIAVHNHPSSAPFSLQDYMSFSGIPKLKAFVATGNNGFSYLIEKLPEFNQVAFERFLQDKFIYPVSKGEVTEFQAALNIFKELIGNGEIYGLFVDAG